MIVNENKNPYDRRESTSATRADPDAPGPPEDLKTAPPIGSIQPTTPSKTLSQRLADLDHSLTYGSGRKPTETENPLAEWSLRLAERTAKLARDEATRKHNEALRPEYIITLVHGTFASKEQWVEPDQPLGMALRKGLEGRARVVPFRWSGANSVRQRATAAQELKTHLEEQRRQHANAKHIVIAHSHGGNIALMAIDSEVLAKDIFGVATLGTPFLVVNRRQTTGIIDTGVVLFAPLFSGIAVLSVGAAMARGWALWLEALVTAVGIFLALILGAWLSDRGQKHADNICRDMPETFLKPEQVKIIRTRGDEAAAAISGSRVAGACLNLFWKRTSEPILCWLSSALSLWDYGGIKALQEQVMKKSDLKIDGWNRPIRPGSSVFPPVLGGPLGGYPYGLVGLSFSQWPKSNEWWQRPTEPWSPKKLLGNGTAGWLGPAIISGLQEPNAATRWICAALAIAYGIPAMLALFITLASIPFVIVFALGLFPCGWSVPFAGPYIDMTAEPAPHGTWSVTQIDPGSDATLQHGKAHDDPLVHQDLVEWIKKRAVATASTPA